MVPDRGHAFNRRAAPPLTRAPIWRGCGPVATPFPLPMTDAPDTPPDRLSVNPKSPHFNAEVLQRDVGIRFNGEERTNIEEYCVSEGWVRVSVGKTVDRRGDPLTIKISGVVEPYYRSK